MLQTRRTHDRIVNTKPGCKTDCFAPRLRFGVVLHLDPVSNEEIINQQTDPAEHQDSNGKENFPDKTDFVVLEDVEHAPDGEDNTQDVNDFW